MRERLAELLTHEFAALLTACGVFSYFFYLLFLRKLTQSRHSLLRGYFKELVLTFIPFAAAYGFYMFIALKGVNVTVETYSGVAALCLGCFFFIRVCKIIVNEYLFLSSMREGVPILLVDMVLLVISLFIISWILTSVFGVRLAPLLATSALLSVVLGFALQDTLGNLFAGVALQFDKPYEIGDWIEVHADSRIFIGEVHEISWRATVLFGLFDEVLTIPNRLMSQSEVTNFSGRQKPIYQGFSIFLDPEADGEKVRGIFELALKESPGILQNQQHFIMLRELGENGAKWRIAYAIESYSRQFLIVNDVLVRVQRDLKKNGIKIGRFRIDTGSESIQGIS